MISRTQLSGVLDSLQKKPGRISRRSYQSSQVPKTRGQLNQKDNQERQICPLKGRSRPAHTEETPPNERTKEAQKLAYTQPGKKQRALRDGPGNPTSACHHVGHGLSYHGIIRSTFSSQTWKHVFRHGLIFRLDAKTRWPWHSCCVGWFLDSRRNRNNRSSD